MSLNAICLKMYIKCNRKASYHYKSRKQEIIDLLLQEKLSMDDADTFCGFVLQYF